MRKSVNIIAFLDSSSKITPSDSLEPPPNSHSFWVKIGFCPFLPKCVKMILLRPSYALCISCIDLSAKFICIFTVWCILFELWEN